MKRNDLVRKLLFPALCLTLLPPFAAGCKRQAPAPTPSPTAAATPAPTADPNTALTGYAVQLSTAESKAADGKTDGVAKTDATISAVTLNGTGVITSCKLDALQTAIHFSSTGKLTTDAATTVFQTKNALGDAYGMRVASGIGKEWNEQTAAFAAYCVGKTVDEVGGIAMTESGTAADADLAAACTVHIGDFIEIVKKAAGNAAALGAKPGDRLGIGVAAGMGAATAATAEADGAATLDSTFAFVTLGEDGAITSCIIDGAQAKLAFDRNGTLTGDASAPIETKNALGSAYGMQGASGIGKEWNEQAAAFAAYCVGKTADAVSGIAMTESGTPADTDLASSCTIHIGDFIEAVAKAAKNAG